jgi:hypothetical protein
VLLYLVIRYFAVCQGLLILSNDRCGVACMFHVVISCR